MTTPTREQVVKLFEQAGETANWKPGFGNDRVIDYLGHFATLARADLEATIAEQKAEIATLQSKADALVDALEEVSSWLVCSPIATSEDMAQSFPHMYSVCDTALTTYKESKQ